MSAAAGVLALLASALVTVVAIAAPEVAQVAADLVGVAGKRMP